MKVVVILLGVGLLILGVLYFQESRRGKATGEQLAVVGDQLAAAQEELASVKTQMTLRVAELESTLATNKALADKQVGQLQGRLRTVEQDLLAEKNKLATVEDERTRAMNQLHTLSNQLASVRQHDVDLTPTSQAELEALRKRGATLEMQKALLERQLNDLDALRARIRIVSRQLWKNRIEQWKRQDRETRLTGNKGLLFKSGQWQTGGKMVTSQ